MPRVASRVSDMEIDEISLVDRPANAFARVRLAKRASQEDAVPEDEEIEQIFDANGTPVDVEDLEFGDVVYDEAGQGYEFLPPTEQYDEDEPQLVGKAAEPEGLTPFLGSHLHGPNKPPMSRVFGLDSDTRAKRLRMARMAGVGAGGAAAGAAAGYGGGRVRKSFADEVREELAKAVTDSDRDEVFAKALDALSAADERAARAEEIAKSERDLRLEREYIAKAADYNVPIASEELGPVLMHCADALSYADCAVLHKALSAAGEMLFTEAGFTGEADNADPFSAIDAHLEEASRRVVSKGGEAVSKAQAMTDFFATNPEAYDEYVASRNA